MKRVTEVKHCNGPKLIAGRKCCFLEVFLVSFTRILAFYAESESISPLMSGFPK